MQYDVYLKAEMGKLVDHGNADSFLQSIPHAMLGPLGVSTVVDELMKQFATQQAVNKYVEGLTSEQKIELTALCDSRWRHNGVSMRLRESQSWYLQDVPVDRIFVQYAEPDLRDLFRENNMELSRIAAHEDLWQATPYSGWNADREVAFPVCLARLIDGRYVIFDGVHRAIQQFKNGAATIQLCLYDVALG